MKLTDLLNDLQQACIALNSKANFQEADSDYFYRIESEEMAIENCYFKIEFSSLKASPDVNLKIWKAYWMDSDKDLIYVKTLYNAELIDWIRLMEFIDKKISKYLEFLND